ncbi:MAG: hypothetical protein V2B18_11480 [Pseudomonadota bacterium]
MLWRIFSVLLLADACPALDPCAEMQKSLKQLRLQFRDMARNPSKTSGEVRFDKLMTVMDRIIALKATMRQTNCRTPPRNEDLGEPEGRPKLGRTQTRK